MRRYPRKLGGREEAVLARALNPEVVCFDLVVSHPNIFNFSNLCSRDKLTLLKTRKSVYRKIFPVSEMTVNEIYDMAMFEPKRYFKYIPWDELSIKKRSNFIIDQTTVAIEENISLDKITSDAWEALLKTRFRKFQKEYRMNIASQQATDVRKVMRAVPKLLKYITYTDIDNSKMNAKEWMLLSQYPVIVKGGGMFKEETLQYLEGELVVGVLSDDFTNSRMLRRARDNAQREN